MVSKLDFTKKRKKNGDDFLTYIIFNFVHRKGNAMEFTIESIINYFLDLKICRISFWLMTE